MSIFSKLLFKASKEDVIRFDYELNFTVIPDLTKEYNNNMSADYTILLNYKAPGNVSKTVDWLYRKVKTIVSEINGYPGVCLVLVEMPNSGMVSEAEIGMIAINRNLHHAVYFTMEYSIGCYMMCDTDEKGHGSIKEVKDREQFCYEVFKSAMCFWKRLESARNPTAEF